MCNGMKLALAATLLLGTVQAASAGVLTESFSDPASGFRTTPIGPDPYTFQGFNALATTNSLSNVHLDSVMISIKEAAYLSGSGTAGSNGTVLDLTVNNTGSVSFTSFSLTSLSVADSTYYSSPSLSAAQNYTFPTETPFNTNSGTYTTSALLADFSSNWTSTFQDTGFASIGTSSGNVTNGTASDQGNVTVTATYTYSADPIPEPAGVAMLASGLLAMGMLRRRRG